MARVLSFLIRYFSNYYTLHRSDLAARAAPLDPRLRFSTIPYFYGNFEINYISNFYSTKIKLFVFESPYSVDGQMLFGINTSSCGRSH